MSSIRLRTLADYMHHDFMVWIGCGSCGRSQELDPTKLYWLFLNRGWSTRIEDVPERFRCGKCGTKNARIGNGGFAS